MNRNPLDDMTAPISIGEWLKLKAQHASLRSALIHLEQAYRNPHSPQHRKSALIEAAGVIESTKP